MHEMAVTSNILDIVLTEAEKAGAAKVTRITLVIGELSSIIDESVQLYFDMLSEETLAAGAILDFHRIYATLRCRACGHTFKKQGSHFTCPLCGEQGMLTGDAKEFYIESIEVE
ncbi:MAG TPA: hydrogenase maturation nickel metallochaperone HypA [Armatimonadota bacterium]|nr:hydrogenase maturation nickel metallochaperone HypA [Armatimonadota bacterium]